MSNEQPPPKTVFLNTVQIGVLSELLTTGLAHEQQKTTQANITITESKELITLKEMKSELSDMPLDEKNKDQLGLWIDELISIAELKGKDQASTVNKHLPKIENIIKHYKCLHEPEKNG